MAYNGYLVKVGTTKLPTKYIKASSYEATPNQRQDLDSYRNGAGVLQRNVLEHTASKVEFNTIPMKNDDMAGFMELIRSNYTSEKERKLSLDYYCPDTDSYKSGNFYVPDIPFPINRVDDTNNIIWYDSTTIKFIEY